MCNKVNRFVIFCPQLTKPKDYRVWIDVQTLSYLTAISLSSRRTVVVGKSHCRSATTLTRRVSGLKHQLTFEPEKDKPIVNEKRSTSPTNVTLIIDSLRYFSIIISTLLTSLSEQPFTLMKCVVTFNKRSDMTRGKSVLL